MSISIPADVNPVEAIALTPDNTSGVYILDIAKLKATGAPGRLIEQGILQRAKPESKAVYEAGVGFMIISVDARTNLVDGKVTISSACVTRPELAARAWEYECCHLGAVLLNDARTEDQKRISAVIFTSAIAIYLDRNNMHGSKSNLKATQRPAVA